MKRTWSRRSRWYSDGTGSLTLSTQVGRRPHLVGGRRCAGAPASRNASSVIADPTPAPVSTSTSWPRRTSSVTPMAVSATRSSWSLTSRGTPTRMPAPPSGSATLAPRPGPSSISGPPVVARWHDAAMGTTPRPDGVADVIPLVRPARWDWVPRTKLFRPPTVADTVLDPDLLDRTARAVDDVPVTTIVATAGAGKSTLASAVVERTGRRAAWLRVRRARRRPGERRRAPRPSPRPAGRGRVRRLAPAARHRPARRGGPAARRRGAGQRPRRRRAAPAAPGARRPAHRRRRGPGARLPRRQPPARAAPADHRPPRPAGAGGAPARPGAAAPRSATPTCASRPSAPRSCSTTTSGWASPPSACARWWRRPTAG